MESESKDATIDVADNDNGDTKSMEDKWPLGYSDESPSSLAELKNTECQILKFIEKHSSENSQKQSEQEEPFNEFEFENESCNNILQNKDRNQERSLQSIERNQNLTNPERSLQSIERNQNLTNQERSLQSIERNQNLTNQERSLQSIERNQNLTNQERSLQSIERNQNLINLHGNVQISPSRSKRINRTAIFRIPSNPPTSANQSSVQRIVSNPPIAANQSSVQRIVSNPPTVDSTVPLPSLSNITHFTDNLPIDDLLNSNILIQNAFQYQKTKSKVQKAAITEDTCKQCVPNYIIMNQDEQDKCKIRIKKHSKNISYFSNI
ncbi:hypothetical protein TVAG_158100 [Trichomonas vaginalis G3]|uniref:Uncharacterized protein n=1 Tax=Trichomonas vaginalis (strain ATCC PRA-98 / G3) TaxID=412133 RepID=A2F9Q8_TRIV3|nr:hypothetical protein TVAG_158100 [Trichomonas vaginalis G3]|eukprot:XP_001311280.1 hypothetical protein [Trichomonas vaginalis G3]